jgi:hypothetical protein
MEERKVAIVHGREDDALWEDSDKRTVSFVTQGLVTDGR